MTLLNSYQFQPSGGGGGSLVSDTFNRANAASLGTSSSGAVWTVHTADTWSIVSNQADPPSIGGYSVASLDSGETDVTITVTVYPESGGVDIGLAARVVDNNNFVFLDVSKSGANYTTRTFKRVGGSFTGITSALGPPLSGVTAQPDPFTISMVLSGSGGESFVAGNSVGTFTGLSGPLLTATRHGIVIGPSSGGLFDTFDVSA